MEQAFGQFGPAVLPPHICPLPSPALAHPPPTLQRQGEQGGGHDAVGTLFSNCQNFNCVSNNLLATNANQAPHGLL